MKNIENLVDSILSDNRIDARNTFTAIMKEKSNVAIDGRRIAVAKSMFETPPDDK